MKAVKDNKEYTIDESQMKIYQDGGFDIKDDEGQVIAYGRGKTVPFGDYANLKAENDVLKTEAEALRAENDALKARAAELEAASAEKKKPSGREGGE